jgi:hypothetical protein
MGEPNLSAVRWPIEALRWRSYALARKCWRVIGSKETHWARVVMDRETDRYIRSMPYASCDALEISGTKWKKLGFASYRSESFPDYDVCDKPLKLEGFDVVVAEQVLEHVLWPYRAVRNTWSMLRDGGVFIVTTPFLLRVHKCPVDCSRWTELGLKQLLVEGGFEADQIITGSWGNRACVRANFRRWRRWISWAHSLRNESDFPVVVWAFARKGSAHQSSGNP